MKRAQAAMARQSLPKRFYKDVTVEQRDGAFAVLLDGRTAKTPKRNLLALRTSAAAELLAAEWRAQVSVIDPGQMHLTRIVNAALDHVAEQRVEVEADIVRYAGSDLVCYRAADPAGLVVRQAAAWDPVVAWAEKKLQAKVHLAEGVMHVAQDDAALAAVARAVAIYADPVALSALHVVTAMGGSALVALMAGAGALDGDAAWAAVTVDEVWSRDTWGEDAEAEARLAFKQGEFLAALGLVIALRM
jgi:chaperone required for assembly of F1-ATPase